jgi:hypothetical protein
MLAKKPPRSVCCSAATSDHLAFIFYCTLLHVTIEERNGAGHFLLRFMSLRPPDATLNKDS